MAEWEQFFDLDAFRGTKLAGEPFPYLTVPRFIRPDVFERLDREFPAIAEPGSFPPSELSYGAYFQSFLDALASPGFRELFAEKFGMVLGEFAPLVTVRGRIRSTDGRIHTDTRSKLITVLLYFNRDWDDNGGRLRLLRSPDDLDDWLEEIPPVNGQLLAFRVTANSWHGHLPASGPRRAIQLNWVTDPEVLHREETRHRMSARVKKLTSFLRPRAAAQP